MAVVVRNDSSGEIQIPGRGNQNPLQPGQVAVLTEEEYGKINLQTRGPGKLVAISPNENTSETLKIKMDYYAPDGSDYEVRYLGYARQSALDADLVWTVRRHNHTLFGSAQWALTEIQVLENVAWADRASLPWL